jgi:predicted XRE-type DNA-binding protein
MKKQQLERVRGSGNVFQDFGDADAEILQLKAILAAEIIKQLDKQNITVREAQSQTGVPAADFSRIRQANLARFSVDRLMTPIIRLGTSVDLSFKARRIKITVPS